MLGPEAILRGHHHTAWAEAIFRTYRKQMYPPWTAKKHKKKDKTALGLSSVLVKECWALFESVWATRNEILHSKDSIGAKIHHGHLSEQLLHFKCNADSMLCYGDRNLIDHLQAETLSWTRARKSGLLRLLKRWHKQYRVETLLATKDQKSLTKFGFSVERTAGGQQDLDNPSIGNVVT